MELKRYQKQVLQDLTRFLELLNETQNSKDAYRTFWNERGIQVPFGSIKPYQNLIDGVPNICFKVPTGGGKTYLAANAIKPIFDHLPERKIRFVVWLVPSDAILLQTIKALKNPAHFYRQKINTDFGNRVEVFSKQELLSGQGFSITAVSEQLSICVLSYDSFRGRAESLKAKRENSNLAGFAKALGAPDHPLEDVDETALLQVINQLHPLVIVDESHHARSDLSLKMLQDFNPCFVLDLTATPRQESNVISYVDALQLKSEHMVKLPVIVYNRDKKEQVLVDAIDLRDNLERLAEKARQKSGCYIRPIVLLQAQPRGREDSTTFEALRERLIKIGIPKNQIAIRTHNINELKNVDLEDENCSIRYIITVNALKEGWDCPFAYILASLANKTSTVDVEQILGRVLRLPKTKEHPINALNMSYVLTSSADFSSTLSEIVKGLNYAGFTDKDYRAFTGCADDGITKDGIVWMEQQIADLTGGVYYGDSKEEPTESPNDTGEVTEEFLTFDDAHIADALHMRKNAEDNHEIPDDASGRLLDPAESIYQQYMLSVSKRENISTRGLPQDVRYEMGTFSIRTAFQEEIKELALPQFFRLIPVNPFMKSAGVNDEMVRLEKTQMADSFTLRGKPFAINYDVIDIEMAKIDVQGSEDPGVPKIFIMKDNEQRLMKEMFSKLPAEERIIKCKEIIHNQLNRLNMIDSEDLRRYIDLIVEDMDTDRLASLEKSPGKYAYHIKEMIMALLEDHYRTTFQDWIEKGTAICRPSYHLPAEINLTAYTTDFGGTLYDAEEDIRNTLEREVALQITSLDNLRWWHRNDQYNGFCINGFLNHYPDFIVRTLKGTIVIVESKGGHLKNRESMEKLELGRIWQSQANQCGDGKQYRYYMVFERTEDEIKGAVSIAQFMDYMKDL